VFSFNFRVSLISVCLVVCRRDFCPSCQDGGNELEEVKSAKLLTLTVRAEASCLKPAGSTDVLSCNG
jgi:hypothetical protein